MEVKIRINLSNHLAYSDYKVSEIPTWEFQLAWGAGISDMFSKLRFLTLFNICVLLLIASRFVCLLHLIHDRCPENMIEGSELKDIGSIPDDSRPDEIPKRIHQVFFNIEKSAMPQAWQDGQASIKRMNPDYEYILWSADMAYELLEKHYSWFLPTFESYAYPVMKFDAIRYIILYHYGGIYIDLDYGAEKDFNKLLAFPAWIPKTFPVGVSNDLMAAKAKHPFFWQVITSLKGNKKNMLLPYATVMFSTGSLYLSIELQKYQSHMAADDNRVRIAYPSLIYQGDGKRTFSHLKGSSWHRADAEYLVYLYKHGWVIFCLASLGAFVYISLQLLLYRILFNRRWQSMWCRLGRNVGNTLFFSSDKIPKSSDKEA